jgi:oxygen-independent coproporphyrinogen-3 oxidase
MVSAIIHEMKMRKEQEFPEKIQTIYFGGGTPSLLSYDEMMRIFEAIQQYTFLATDAEITLEANPDDLTPQKLREIRQTPVNRFSIGIQSFFEEDLKLMNRAHNAHEGEYSVKAAQDSGFENITIDLIYAIPGLSTDRWRKNLDAAMALDVPHISAYCMTIEEKTVFGKWEKTGKLPALDDHIALEHYRHLIQTLSENAFEHYEVSNFGKANKHSQHNTSYWKGLPYIGLGPSAHSFDGINKRSWNVSNNAIYIRELQQNKLPADFEILSQKDFYNEKIMTGLRTAAGVNAQEIQLQFGVSVTEQFSEEIARYQSAEWLQISDNQIRLTEEGFFRADRIASDFFITEEIQL